MREIVSNKNGSIYPVLTFIFALCAASFLLLLLGEFLSPVFTHVFSIDLGVAEDVAAPRNLVESFFLIIWPKGILAFLFIVLSAATFMSYQKSNYKDTGGGWF